MLVLCRQEGQKIQIGQDITITVVEIIGDRIRIGIDAPKSIPVDRMEIAEQKKAGIRKNSAQPPVNSFARLQ